MANIERGGGGGGRGLCHFYDRDILLDEIDNLKWGEGDNGLYCIMQMGAECDREWGEEYKIQGLDSVGYNECKFKGV